MRTSIFVLTIVLFSLNLKHSFAKNETTVKNANKVGNYYYKKTTRVDFLSDTISGDLTKPDGEYISARQLTKLKNLIQLRENWKKQIDQAIDEI